MDIINYDSLISHKQYFIYNILKKIKKYKLSNILINYIKEYNILLYLLNINKYKLFFNIYKQIILFDNYKEYFIVKCINDKNIKDKNIKILLFDYIFININDTQFIKNIFYYCFDAKRYQICTIFIDKKFIKINVNNAYDITLYLTIVSCYKKNQYKFFDNLMDNIIFNNENSIISELLRYNDFLYTFQHCIINKLNKYNKLHIHTPPYFINYFKHYDYNLYCCNYCKIYDRVLNINIDYFDYKNIFNMINMNKKLKK